MRRYHSPPPGYSPPSSPSMPTLTPPPRPFQRSASFTETAAGVFAAPAVASSYRPLSPPHAHLQQQLALLHEQFAASTSSWQAAHDEELRQRAALTQRCEDLQRQLTDLQRVRSEEQVTLAQAQQTRTQLQAAVRHVGDLNAKVAQLESTLRLMQNAAAVQKLQNDNAALYKRQTTHLQVITKVQAERAQAQRARDAAIAERDAMRELVTSVNALAETRLQLLKHLSLAMRCCDYPYVRRLLSTVPYE